MTWHQVGLHSGSKLSNSEWGELPYHPAGAFEVGKQPALAKETTVENKLPVGTGREGYEVPPSCQIPDPTQGSDNELL